MQVRGALMAGRVLLEREGPLRVLSRALTSAKQGAGRFVLLAGEAGVGKSSIIDLFTCVARPHARMLIGRCEPLSTPRPLGPLVDMAPRLGSALRAALASTVSGVGAAALLEAVLVELGTADRPTILVVEDAHWADEATLDLLRLLSRRIADLPSMVVVTFRADELGRTHH